MVINIFVNIVDLNLERRDGESLSQSAGLHDSQAVNNPMIYDSIAVGCNSVIRRSDADVAGASSLLSSGNLWNTETAPILRVNSLDCCWVTQHHSVRSYPDLWSHPVKLLSEFCQTEDYKSCLAAATDDAPSHFCDGTLAGVVRSTLPTSLELKCSAPHLHRWNPSASEDFTDYFHDRIKVLSTAGTVYRYVTGLPNYQLSDLNK